MRLGHGQTCGVHSASSCPDVGGSRQKGWTGGGEGVGEWQRCFPPVQPLQERVMGMPNVKPDPTSKNVAPSKQS